VAGITAYNCTGLRIGANVYGGNMGPLITLAAAPDTGSGMHSVDIDRQTLGNSEGSDQVPLHGIDVIVDNRLNSTPANCQNGSIDHSFTTGVVAQTVGTWVTLGYFDLPVNASGVQLDILLTGYDWSVGPMFAHYRRALTKAEGSGTVTVTTLGTDETAGVGSHYAVQFVTTTAKRVIAQYQLTTAGTTLIGRAKVTPQGDIARSHVGP